MLKLRYEEIEKACAEPFPESEKSLDELRRVWNVTDQQWLSSFVLICQRPFEIPSPSEQVLAPHAFLCLAAMKRWQMEHDGEQPDSLLATVKEINRIGRSSGRSVVRKSAIV